MSLEHLEFAALDFETTGLDPDEGDRVVEVAVVRGPLHAEPSRWCTLVFPDRPMAATGVHGITAAMVATAPRFAAVLPELLRRVEGAVLACHNADFDLGFLDMECARAGVSRPEQPVVDTLLLARRLLAVGDHRLSALRERFDLPREVEHRALDDAHATFLLARRLVAAADPAGELDLPGLLELCQPRDKGELDRVRQRLAAAQQSGERLLVDYVSGDSGAASRREITVTKLARSRVVAHCHLRDASRTFRLDRLRLVD
ncbi:MAG: hypothetical protein FJ102_06895 [Deltaproteobacteria bacterium]|nr:hypothetical protein [Deltaproteobacteria bacterium]